MIPAYEDQVLVATIRDAIDKSENPENLYFAVAMQFDEVPYPDISEWKSNPNFKFLDYEVASRPGVMQLRNILAKHHKDQEYVLLCDSHMTFEDAWDTKLMEDYKILQSLQGEKVIISAQMGEDMRHLGYSYQCNCHSGSGKAHHRITTWDRPKKIDNFTFLKASTAGAVTEHEDFIPTYYSSHHMFFFQKDYILDGWMFDSVRNYGEETFSSWIAFMKGWTIYTSYRHVYMYHNHNANGDYLESLKTKSFSALIDLGSTIYEVIRAMLYNEGKYSIKTNKDPREFYDVIGLGYAYDAIIASKQFESSTPPDFGDTPT